MRDPTSGSRDEPCTGRLCDIQQDGCTHTVRSHKAAPWSQQATNLSHITPDTRTREHTMPISDITQERPASETRTFPFRCNAAAACATSRHQIKPITQTRPPDRLPTPLPDATPRLCAATTQEPLVVILVVIHTSTPGLSMPSKLIEHGCPDRPLGSPSAHPQNAPVGCTAPPPREPPKVPPASRCNDPYPASHLLPAHLAPITLSAVASSIPAKLMSIALCASRKERQGIEHVTRLRNRVSRRQK